MYKEYQIIKRIENPGLPQFIPLFRKIQRFAVVAQSVEHFIGNEEVHGFDSRQQLHETRLSQWLAGFGNYYVSNKTYQQKFGAATVLVDSFFALYFYFRY